MASDYESIRADNKLRYGTDIGRIGPMLLANRYDDRTHFIFELLQNAEDALARRLEWKGTRSVDFCLSADALRVSHFGKLFDEHDVGGICGIAESTKDKELTSIGRFGIGFKSVYAFTNRPEVHSGSEDFSIENYVWPLAAPRADQKADETVFVLPLRADDQDAHAEIAAGLQRLGPRTLLFLRNIEGISWKVEGGSSGLYLRGKRDAVGEGVHRVVLLGEERDRPDVEETWLVFSREAKTPDGVLAGHVEVAFAVDSSGPSDRSAVRAVGNSPLVVFFPTVVPTHLGMLVQGPYRTTPSRDNVPRNDPWNQQLVKETSALLVEALRSLRTQGLLDVGALLCLPLDRTVFGEGNMFAPLFTAVREALKTEPLLPAYGGGHAPASGSKLARTQELRELFSSDQLAALFGSDGSVVWLSGDITPDRTPELRQYVMQELEISEITPESLAPSLTQSFLQKQSEAWISRLYGFLLGQPALLRQGRLKDVPLVRLRDGRHVTSTKNGRPQAFLPGPIETDLPTVHQAVCSTEDARAFLRSIGVSEPDPVDAVIENVLPKYQGKEIAVNDEAYEADIRRIVAAFGADSKTQRDKLIAALRERLFVRSVMFDDGVKKYFTVPPNVYLATRRLQDLFEGVGEVLIVDDSYACLQGEDVREMLEACGAVRYLRPIADTSLSLEERSQLRILAGHPSTSNSKDSVTDWTLSGLSGILGRLQELEPLQRKERARLLWEELPQLVDRRGEGTFTGVYTWTHYGRYEKDFDAAFVRQLNRTAWVPDEAGELQVPGVVIFDSLGWKPNPFLLSKIRFKPPVIDQLAKEAGIELGVIHLLKKLGVTSVADLKRFGIIEQSDTDGSSSSVNVDEALKKLLGDAPGPTPPVTDPTSEEGAEGGNSSGSGGSGQSGNGHRAGSSGGDGGREKHEGGAGADHGKRTPGSPGGRPFISYVATQPDDAAEDPDGLDQSARMALEEKAIALILSRELNWRRTPTQNKGFDLFEPSQAGRSAQWCEVKAMSGTLHDRPVGLSRAQFEFAQDKGDDYWLYAVERAGESDARIVRIQNPAGKAHTFTFDRGWLDVAAPEVVQANRKD